MINFGLYTRALGVYAVDRILRWRKGVNANAQAWIDLELKKRDEVRIAAVPDGAATIASVTRCSTRIVMRGRGPRGQRDVVGLR